MIFFSVFVMPIMNILAIQLITGEVTPFTLVSAALLGISFATIHIVEAIKSTKKDAA